jgi:hypothetical protein
VLLRILVIVPTTIDLPAENFGFAVVNIQVNCCIVLVTGDVVVHIFLPPQRAFYNLEEFYANAIPIELLFDNQPPFRS